jgi:hypothetical protein
MKIILNYYMPWRGAGHYKNEMKEVNLTVPLNPAGPTL